VALFRDANSAGEGVVDENLRPPCLASALAAMLSIHFGFTMAPAIGQVGYSVALAFAVLRATD